MVPWCNNGSTANVGEGNNETTLQRNLVGNLVPYGVLSINNPVAGIDWTGFRREVSRFEFSGGISYQR